MGGSVDGSPTGRKSGRPGCARNGLARTRVHRPTARRTRSRDPAAHLPHEVYTPLTNVDEEARSDDRDAFETRRAARLDVDRDDAVAIARAVSDALEETAAGPELDRVRTQLPNEFDPLVAPSE